jgi:hypothetical protein
MAAGNTRETSSNRWTVGDDKEGSRQEQTTTNHCALKANWRWPAERAAGVKNGNDDGSSCGSMT